MNKSTDKKITVQLVSSLIGQIESNYATIRGLGLRKVNSQSVLQDTPSVRGMINKVKHLVKIVE
jgi:large subunit ribosomal protein L30